MCNGLLDPLDVLVKVLRDADRVTDIICFKQLFDKVPLFFVQTQNCVRYSDYGRHDRILVRLFLACDVQFDVSHTLKTVAVRTIQQKVRQHMHCVVSQRYAKAPYCSVIVHGPCRLKAKSAPERRVGLVDYFVIFLVRNLFCELPHGVLLIW